QVESWIDAHLPPDYPWPGNVRQLWQCVREIFVSGAYHPLDVRGDDDPVRSLRAGTLTESQALDRYATIVQARTGSVAETARVLGVHGHTVARRIDGTLRARMTGGVGEAGAGSAEQRRPARRR